MSAILHAIEIRSGLQVLESTRLKAIYLTILSLGAMMLFVSIGTALGFPLEYEQALILGKITLPTFIGYLAIAAVYATSQARSRPPSSRRLPLIKALLYGPMILFWIVNLATFMAFYFNNTHSTSEFTFDTLSNIVSITVSILVASTSVVITGLFQSEDS